MTHERLSVHNITFHGEPLADLEAHWSALNVSRLSILDDQLLDPEFPQILQHNTCRVEAVTHIFAGGRPGSDPQPAREALSTVIDAAARVGARTIYMLTGGRGDLTWEQAAERFCNMVGPCADQAKRAGVALAIECASGLYADIHLAHTLRDTITLAEMSDLSICIDVFHCWAEADFDALVQRALPRTALIQLSDYVLGDRALPARAVPGDGAIPLEHFIALTLAGGYTKGFDLELIGPRIDDEGRLESARRACQVVSAMLDRLGG